MRAILTSLSLLLSLSPSLRSADTWSIEYHRGLANKQRGDLSILLHGDRVFSHGFLEPAQAFFPAKIPANARVELVVSITEAPGTVWGSNPMHQDIPEAPARLALILQRNWTTPFGRWFSVLSIEIRPGVHRLVVPVQSWAWIHVYGQPGNTSPDHSDAWRRSWKSPARIGVVGGGHFKAHGIEVLEGVGEIRVLSLKVIGKR